MIFDSNGQVKSYSFERNGEPVKPEDETDLYFHTFDYTDSTEIREYKNYYFRPTCNNLGVYKTVLNYNQNGIPVSKENFDQNGQLMADSAGVARYIWELNEENLIVSEKYQNLDGNFITNRWGIFEMKNRWNDDDDFCFFESRYYDKNGKNVISEKDRFAGWDGQFDKSDNLVCATYYDNEGKPAETGSVSGRVRYKYDDNGLMTERSYHEINDKLKEINGIAIYNYIYNGYGNVSEIKMFNIRNQLLPYGVAIIRYEYDDKNNFQKVSYYDDKEQLIEN